MLNQLRAILHQTKLRKLKAIALCSQIAASIAMAIAYIVIAMNNGWQIFHHWGLF